MKRRNIARAGLILSLTAAIVAMVIALIPEKSGIRIPVHVANGNMGFIDDTGRMVLAAKWMRATPFNQDGTCFVTSERRVRRYGFQARGHPLFRTYTTLKQEDWKMDRLGTLTSYPRIQISQRHPDERPAAPDSHGMILIRDRRGVRWVKADGSEAFLGRWEEGIDFKNDDPAAVRTGGRWGFINRKGEAVTPLEWDQTQGFNGRGRACVAVNNKWGVINAKGDLIVPLYFNHLSGFDGKGMCAGSLESGSGFIDPAGKIIIPFRHARVEPFDHFDMAKVMMRDDDDNLRVGWIDRKGKLVIPCIYHDMVPDWVWRFKDHELLPVCDLKGFGLIDRKGRVVIPTGSGSLAHVEDPIAPGRFWITRVPGGVFGGPPPAFKPACYDQDGKPIWQGKSRTRAQTATGIALFFGVVFAILCVVVLRRQHGVASTGEPSIAKAA
jgi:hypothetical protein